MYDVTYIRNVYLKTNKTIKLFSFNKLCLVWERFQNKTELFVGFIVI